jgi:hypothetical protein
MFIPYCGTQLLDTVTARNPSPFSRAVVVIHGSRRNAEDYFRFVRGSAIAVGEEDSTIVLAPQFLTNEDLVRPEVANQLDLLYWNQGWREGEISATRDGQVSSYDIVDAMLRTLLDSARFPALTDVIVAGHSAGGQFVNRFAAGSPVQDEGAAAGKRFRYVIANPSSYLYYSETRPVPGSTTEFEVPSPELQASCPGWNDYKYGIGRIDPTLNPYMFSDGRAAELLAERYARREAIYLLGEQDRFDLFELDTTCQAMLQGRWRLERGLAYYNYLGLQFGRTSPDIYSRHLLDTVPDVGHDGDQMFNSAQGRRWLFDEAVEPPANADSLTRTGN